MKIHANEATLLAYLYPKVLEQVQTEKAAVSRLQKI